MTLVAGSSDSASDSSDFEGALGGATIGDIVQPFSEIQPWRFEPPARSTVSPDTVENPEPPRRRCELDSEEWFSRGVVVATVRRCLERRRTSVAKK